MRVSLTIGSDITVSIIPVTDAEERFLEIFKDYDFADIQVNKRSDGRYGYMSEPHNVSDVLLILKNKPQPIVADEEATK